MGQPERDDINARLADVGQKYGELTLRPAVPVGEADPPQEPGVYVFIEDHPCYVGRTSNLRRRIQQHRLGNGRAGHLPATIVRHDGIDITEAKPAVPLSRATRPPTSPNSTTRTGASSSAPTAVVATPRSSPTPGRPRPAAAAAWTAAGVRERRTGHPRPRRPGAQPVRRRDLICAAVADAPSAPQPAQQPGSKGHTRSGLDLSVYGIPTYDPLAIRLYSLNKKFT